MGIWAGEFGKRCAAFSAEEDAARFDVFARESVGIMPQRPSKKVKPQPGAKPEVVKGIAGADQASQERHREKTTKAILGKFQGRKSI